MIALYFYAQIFEARPTLPAIRKIDAPARLVRASESTVFYLALEKDDTLHDISHCLAEFVGMRGRLSLPLILHSFNHLSDHSMPLHQAKKMYEALPEILLGDGVATVEWTTFGWIYEVLMQDVGENGSKGRLVCPQH